MTYIHLSLAFFSNPGYIPKWLKVPMNSQREAPLDLVRIYNMRFWMANNIYSFDEFIKPESGQEDSNISINLDSSLELNSPTIANNLTIEEETTQRTTTNSLNQDIEMQSLHTGNQSSTISATVPRTSLKDIPLKITPETMVDTNKLTPLELKIFNLPVDDWVKLENDILSQFPQETLNLIVWRYCKKC